MTASEGATIEGKEQALTEWYRAELKQVLETVFDACKKKTGIDAEAAKIKKMKTCWGTCNIEKQRIWANLQLVKKPPECLEYIVVHELVHLLERNHTSRFNALVEEYCPTWKEAKKLLIELPLDDIEKDIHAFAVLREPVHDFAMIAGNAESIVDLRSFMFYTLACFYRLTKTIASIH